MNRCRRCATVISGAIVAGVIYGGVGMGVATSAWADPADSGEAAGTGATVPGAPDGSNATGPRRPRARDSSPVRFGSTVSDHWEGRVVGGRARPAPDHTGIDPEDSDGEGGAGEEWHCPWWAFVEPIGPPQPAGLDNGGWFGFQGTVAVTPPVAQLVGAAAVGLRGPDLAVTQPPPARAAPPVAAAEPVPAGPDPGAGARAGAERPTAVALAGPPSRLPGPPAPRTSPPGQPPESVRLGYPDYLRQADIAELASVALPGLAAIMGLTALGGLFGYRQAKAGYLLRAAGPGRFLR